MLYLLRVLWRIDRGTFFSMTAHIVLGAVAPFVSVLIPSVIISLLLHHHAILDFFLILGGLLLLYGILQGLVSYLNEYNAFAFIKSRGLYFIKKVYLSRARLDYVHCLNKRSTRTYWRMRHRQLITTIWGRKVCTMISLHWGQQF